MQKHIPLRDRTLPAYSRGEERMNAITHGMGAGLGILVLILCLGRAATPREQLGALVFGCTMIALYTISCVYHGLKPSMGKKVMQVLDHCAIYCLIAGTYTPILLGAFYPVYPKLSVTLLCLQWGLCAAATVLTAIDLKRYRCFSMTCYICMGWCIILFAKQCILAMGLPGFLLILSGGVVYTVGAVLYGLGSKRKWLHSIFHIFVLGGSLLHFLGVLLYAL